MVRRPYPKQSNERGSWLHCRLPGKMTHFLKEDEEDSVKVKATCCRCHTTSSVLSTVLWEIGETGDAGDVRDMRTGSDFWKWEQRTRDTVYVCGCNFKIVFCISSILISNPSGGRGYFSVIFVYALVFAIFVLCQINLFH